MSVLYDVPGPRTRRRHLIGSLIGGVVLLAILGAIVWKLYTKDQFTKARWEPFTLSGIWQNTLIPGLEATLKAAGLAIVFAVVFGAILCAGRISERRWVRLPVGIVVEFLRATPLLLLILFIFLETKGDLGVIWPLVIGLTLYNGAVLAETFRAGINAIPRGQSEAGLSIGLRKGQVLRSILLPQAVQAMLPAIISQCVVVLKDTSLGYIIGYEELIRKGSLIPQKYDNILPTALVLAAMYIVMNYALSKLAVYLESRLRRTGKATIDPSAEQTQVAESSGQLIP
jgi:glutamate transport system permease protein